LVERLWLGDLESSATGSFDAPAVLETRDDNYDGTVDRETVLFTDRTGSVMGNYGDDGSVGKQLERLHYNMTSQPFLMAWGDVDGDGDADASDESWLGFLWSFSLYDVRGDLDLDGDVDSNDISAHVSGTGGVKLSNDANTLGAQRMHSRFGQCFAWGHSLNQASGVWSTRVANLTSNIYEVAHANSLAYQDHGWAGIANWSPYDPKGGGSTTTPSPGTELPGVCFASEPFPSNGTTQEQNPNSQQDYLAGPPITSGGFEYRAVTSFDARTYSLGECGAGACFLKGKYNMFFQYRRVGSRTWKPVREGDGPHYGNFHHGNRPTLSSGTNPPVKGGHRPNSDANAGNSGLRGQFAAFALCPSSDALTLGNCVELNLEVQAGAGFTVRISMTFCCLCARFSWSP